MKISIIVAMDEKRGIGKDNKIPWHIREDLIKLKTLTKDHVVILGRKTYDSMVWYYNKSGKQMPGKLYIVVTRRSLLREGDSLRTNVTVANSLEEALSFARGRLAKLEEVFVIGGAQIFQQAITIADKLYLTIVEGEFDADAFFPDYSGFKKILFEKKSQSENYKYRFLELEK